MMKFSYRASGILLGCLFSLTSTVAIARPNIQPLSANITQTGSAVYQ
ncbi:hypothetical protein [Acinetobacter sp. MB5]|nr:hypothetical protein [Acinetobacter sp. MB5]